jgi:anthranilate synthase component 1
VDTALKTYTNCLVKTLNGERFTPYTLATKLEAQVLLESASFAKGRQRWSLMLVKEAFRVYQKNNSIFLKKDGKSFKIKSQGRDILDALLYFANQHGDVVHDFPFPAGGLGYITYEFASHFDTIKLMQKPDDLNIPDAMFLFGHIFIIFDHYTDTIILLGLNYKERTIDLERAFTQVEERINDLDFNFMTSSKREYTSEIIPNPQDRKDYMRGVERVKEEIIKGNLFQGVLSRRVYIKTNLSAMDSYRSLRSFNPSPYMFYIDCGSFQLFGASPEIHIKVKDGQVLIRPLAGTRKRGKTQEEELALEKDLLSDEKELAEHLMLVDLARNDLGRICRAGSVHVSASMEIERYSHVMHIVSEVVGDLKSGKTGADAMRATFPAGTVSGAPKIKAIEVLDGLEKMRRSFYAGIVGYMEPNGDLDSCIVIRCGFKKKQTLVLQAGAGIVYDSIPEKEFEETENKLKAMEKAVGLEV